MRKLAITTAAALTALAAFCAFGDWVYEGKWGSYGTGKGQFRHVQGILADTNTYVYVADNNNHRVQYFRE